MDAAKVKIALDKAKQKHDAAAQRVNNAWAKEVRRIQGLCRHEHVEEEKDAGYHGSCFDSWECKDCGKYEHR